LRKAKKEERPLQAKAGRGLFVALLLFVGIPLPGTGAWTGTLAASLLDMDFKSSVLAVMLGVILAGLIMGAASAGLFGALICSIQLTGLQEKVYEVYLIANKLIYFFYALKETKTSLCRFRSS